jgi:hypothetical protein
MFRKVIRKAVRHKGDGIDVAADVNAVISANMGRGSTRTHTSSRQTAESGRGQAKNEEKGGRDGRAG